MAITYIGAETNAALSLSITTDVPAGVSNGDTLWAIVSVDESTGNTITDDSENWTKVAEEDEDDGRALRAAIFKKTASSEPASYTFTGGQLANKNMRGTIIAFSSDAAISLDVAYSSVSHFDHTANELNPTNPAITTATDGATVLLFHVQSHNEVTTAGQPTGYTSLVENQASDHRNHAIASKVVATAGTETPGAWTNSGTDSISENLVFTLAMSEAGGGGVSGWDSDGAAVSLNAVGIEGGADTATTVTLNATSHEIKATAITAASGNHVARFVGKLISGGLTFELSVDGGATYTDITSQLSADSFNTVPAEVEQTVTDPQFSLKVTGAVGKSFVFGNGGVHLDETIENLLNVPAIQTTDSAVTISTEGGPADYLIPTLYLKDTVHPIGDDVVVNGDFSLWTDPTAPDGYTKVGTHNASNYVEESAEGMRVVSDGTFMGLQDFDALTVGVYYYYAVTFGTFTTGAVKVVFGNNSEEVSGVENTTVTGVFLCEGNGKVEIDRTAGATDANIVSIVAQPITHGALLNNIDPEDWTR